MLAGHYQKKNQCFHLGFVISQSFFCCVLQLHDHADEALALVKRVCSPAHLTVLDFLFKFLNDLAQYAPQTRYQLFNLILLDEFPLNDMFLASQHVCGEPGAGVRARPAALQTRRRSASDVELLAQAEAIHQERDERVAQVNCVPLLVLLDSNSCSVVSCFLWILFSCVRLPCLFL
jgi:hypothetical protein